MGLVSPVKLINHAREHRYCIPGFDVFNLEILEGVLRACERRASPVMIQTSFVNFDFYELELLAPMLKHLLERSELPVILHLDHGPREMPVEVIEAVLKAGFSSIMADGSHLTLDENIEFVKAIQTLAQPFGAMVEGELGEVSRDPSMGKERIRALMTRPDEAARFVAQTNIDALAISVGSVTACFDSAKIALDFPRLEAIAEQVSIPLVFHGGTGIPDADMRRAVDLGVAKCNIAHGLRKIYSDVLRSALEGTEGYVDPRPILADVIGRIDEYVDRKLELLRCAGKAPRFHRAGITNYEVGKRR